MAKVIGFTGTREGMTNKQKLRLINYLSMGVSLGYTEFHHGDCVGADEEADLIARDLGYKIVIHPPEDDRYRAYCDEDNSLKPKPYLDRNTDIVDSCEMVFATPKEDREQLRSGTWATIRYTVKSGKMNRIIYPDGRVEKREQVIKGDPNGF